MVHMDEFTLAYFEAALWTSTDDDGENLDENYGIEDFAPETSEKMSADCADFQERFDHLIEKGGENLQLPPGGVGGGIWGYAGHDFWLTRNRHGAGFWDGGWPEPEATELTNAAHEYGEFYLYVGDDGLIYGPPPGAHGVREAKTRRPVVPRPPPRVTPRGRGAHRGQEEARRESPHPLSARSGEVIPSKRWENKTTGATASIYGAVPWTGAPGDREEDWELKTVGWTIRWSDGTTGIGRQPFESQREAQDWLDNYNAQHGLAKARGRRRR